MNSAADNDLWQQARQIFEELLDLPQAEALPALERMPDVSVVVKERVQRLFTATQKSKTILQEADSGKIYQRLKTLTNMSGRSIGPYQLEELIAVGGMSSIYKGQRLEAGVQKPVAIKIMSAHARSARIITLFNREQQALSKLNHPNIVSFLHGGQTTEGTYYLVMELIDEAVTLDAYVKEKQCSVKAIVQLVLQAAEAMAYAHNNLVIHRDLKATNLLVDQHGHIKIVDFGIAAFAENYEQPTTQAYTPEIASPEQIRGRNITTKTDIFSLAATLLGLLTDGRALPDFDPDYYDEANDEKYIGQKLAESSLDRDMRNILGKALNTNPDKRYSTMDAFANDLRHWLTQEPVIATSGSALYRMRKAMRRNPLLSGALVVFFVFLMVALWVVRNYAQTAEQQAQQAQMSLGFMTEVLSQADPAAGNPGNMTIRDALKATLQQQQQVLAEDPEMQIAVLSHVSEIYNGLGLFKEAAQTSETVYATLLELPHAEDERIIFEQLQLCNYYHAAGDFEKAIDMAQQVLSATEQRKDSDPHHRLQALNTLIKSYEQLSDNVAAEKYNTEAVRLMESGQLSDDGLMGRSYNSFAVLANRRGDRELASQYYEKSLMHTEKAYTKKSPIYAGILNGYAIHIARGGDLDKAEEVFAESIELMRAFDPESFVLGRNLVQYSHLLYLQGRITYALEMLQEAVDIVEKTDNYYARMMAQEKRVLFYSRLFDFDAALDAALKSIDYAGEVLGEDNRRTIGNVAKLTNLLAALGYPQLVEKNQQKVLAYHRSTEDMDSLNRAHAVIGIAFMQAGQTENAREIYVAANATNTTPNLTELYVLQLLLSPQTELPELPAPKRKDMARLALEVLLARSDDADVDQLCTLDQMVNHSPDVLMKHIFLKRCQQLNPSAAVVQVIDQELQKLESAIERTRLEFEQRYVDRL